MATTPTKEPMMPTLVPLPALDLLLVALALAAAAADTDPEGAAVIAAVLLDREGPEAEDIDDVDDVIEEELDMLMDDEATVEFDIEVIEADDEFVDWVVGAVVTAAAATFALPPPIVERVVHCAGAPAGCGAGVVGSPWWNVDPE